MTPDSSVEGNAVTRPFPKTNLAFDPLHLYHPIDYVKLNSTVYPNGNIVYTGESNHSPYIPDNLITDLSTNP